MKLISLHKTLLFFVILFGSMYMNASDTLKVKKVSFFVEPKVTFIIPIHRHIINSYSTANWEMDPISLPPSIITDNWQNKSTINYGISCGISVRLGKHFSYELSLAYSHYNVKTKVTETIVDLSGNYLGGGTTNFSSLFNSLFIGNGLSYKYKKFILSNNIMIGAISQASLYNIVNNYNSCSIDWYLMSEHKIGYSLFRNRIEPYVGIDILYNNPLIYYPQHVVMPFTSIRINF